MADTPGASGAPDVGGHLLCNTTLYPPTCRSRHWARDQITRPNPVICNLGTTSACSVYRVWSIRFHPDHRYLWNTHRAFHAPATSCPPHIRACPSQGCPLLPNRIIIAAILSNLELAIVAFSIFSAFTPLATRLGVLEIDTDSAARVQKVTPIVLA